MRDGRLNGSATFSSGLRGIPAPTSTLDLRAQTEGQLHALLLAEGIAPRAVYRPGEVCRLLRISPTTLRQFCELSEHPAVKNADPRALDSFLVGCHHRISHAALVEWLVKNQKFQREG